MALTLKKQQKARKVAFSPKDKFTLSVFVGVPTFLHILLVWFPAIATIYLSFTYWTGIGGLSTINFEGLANYKNIFVDTPIFWPAIKNNALWLLWFGVIATPLGVLLAYQIDREIRGHKFYQSAFYLPVVLSMAIIGIIWNFLLRPDGLINGMLGRDITNAVSFFGNYDINYFVVMIIASWRHIGYIMLLYLAGLKAIDPSLREAASIDGATEWQTFRKVILPSMKPVNIIIIVITIIESLRAFDLVYILYGTSAGFPILGILVFQNIAGEAPTVGKGAAYAVILFILSIGPIISYLQQTFKKDNE